MTFIHDGERFLRADQVDAVGETADSRMTNRYAASPALETEYTRHVTMRSGKEFPSPGRAAELVEQIEDHLSDGPFDDLLNPIDPRTED